MPVARFSRVLRGQRGQAAKTRYINYLEALDIEPDIGSRGPRPPEIPLYLTPFGVDLGNELVLEAKAVTTAYNALNGPITAARIKNAVPNGLQALKIRGVRAARVSVTSGLQATGTVATSKLTGLKYANYGGTSQSCPFGRGTATEKEADAFAAIKAALPNTYRRVYLIEERI